jgi:ribosomal protein L7/L12
MKRVITQKGKIITSLDELEDNFHVRVSSLFTIDDLPLSVELATGVSVRREAWVNMVLAFARGQKIQAIKWVRGITGWGLKDAKMFVDSLMEEPQEEIPDSISRDDIIQWCGETNFSRGHNYFMAGHIADITCSRNTVTALCVGSKAQPYTVSVTFDKGGIASSKCSCPVAHRGCKHTAALLLAWSTN